MFWKEAEAGSAACFLRCFSRAVMIYFIAVSISWGRIDTFNGVMIAADTWRCCRVP
jgi:hypothetical protein